MDTRKGPLTVAEFFALDLDDGHMSAASQSTRLAYSTVWRVAQPGASLDVGTAKRLAAWSRTVPAAVAAGVWIDAARSLGLDDADPASADDPRPSQAPEAVRGAA